MRLRSRVPLADSSVRRPLDRGFGPSSCRRSNSFCGIVQRWAIRGDQLHSTCARCPLRSVSGRGFASPCAGGGALLTQEIQYYSFFRGDRPVLGCQRVAIRQTQVSRRHGSVWVIFCEGAHRFLPEIPEPLAGCGTSPIRCGSTASFRTGQDT